MTTPITVTNFPSPRLRGEGGEQRSCEPGEGAFQGVYGDAPSPDHLRCALAHSRCLSIGVLSAKNGGRRPPMLSPPAGRGESGSSLR